MSLDLKAIRAEYEAEIAQPGCTAYRLDTFAALLAEAERLYLVMHPGRFVTLKVKGVAVPQGSYTCVGAGMRTNKKGKQVAAHNVQPANKDDLYPWRKKVAAAARIAAARYGQYVVHDPVRVDLTFTIARPPSVTRDWPSVYPDVDKYVRAIYDGLTEGGVWNDDGQALGGLIWKTYPDMAAWCPIPEDVLDVPGVVIRLSDVAANRLI